MVCWEFFECGREESGEKAKEHGLCPAYPDHGNSCWFVAGTLCEGEPAGTFAQKIGGCQQCEFFGGPKEEVPNANAGEEGS